MTKKIGTGLNPLEIASISSALSCDYSILPKVTPSVFRYYAYKKRETAIGQQQKACSKLTSGKVAFINSFSQLGGISIVKAKIKKSFGD